MGREGERQGQPKQLENVLEASSLGVYLEEQIFFFLHLGILCEDLTFICLYFDDYLKKN